MPAADSMLFETPRNGHRPRNWIRTKLLTSAAEITIRTRSMVRPRSSSRSAHSHARLGAAVRAEQIGPTIAPAGSQHHAFGQAEAHLARGQVGDHDRQPSVQFSRFVVAANAGKDLARFTAEVEFETKQLVGALDQFGPRDACNPQVDPCKFGKLDHRLDRLGHQLALRGFADLLSRRFKGFPAGLDQALELLGLDPAQQWFELVDQDQKSTRLNSSHSGESRMPSS